MVHIVLHQMESQHAMEADCTVDNSGHSWDHTYYAGIHTVPSAIHKHGSDMEGRWSYSSTSHHQMKVISQLHVLTALSMERSTVIQSTDCYHSILYRIMLSNASNWVRMRKMFTFYKTHKIDMLYKLNLKHFHFIFEDVCVIVVFTSSRYSTSHSNFKLFKHCLYCFSH
jgi:hypothetical protein